MATTFRVYARRLCLAVVPVGGGGSWRWAACSDERAVRGLRGLVVVPVGGGGSWRWAACSDERAARGLRGLVVVPVGGGGAWPGFEIDHSERSSCVAISRAGRRPQAQPAGSSGQVAGDGGRCEVCGVWLWCLWAAAGPGRTTPSDERAARGLRGLVVVPVGGGGSWRWAACSDERAA